MPAVALILAQILCAALAVLAAVALPQPPQAFVVGVLPLAMSALFALLLVPQLVRSWRTSTKSTALRVNTVLLYSLCAVIFGAGLATAYPDYKTTADAIAFNQAESAAVARGITVADKVTAGQLPQPRAREQIQIEFANKDHQTIAQRAFVEKISNTNLTDEEILQKVAPTIPLVENTWTCVAVGCSYKDSLYVWTISTANRVTATAILIGTGAIIIFSVNEKLWKRIIKRQR